MALQQADSVEACRDVVRRLVPVEAAALLSRPTMEATLTTTVAAAEVAATATATMTVTTTLPTPSVEEEEMAEQANGGGDAAGAEAAAAAAARANAATRPAPPLTPLRRLLLSWYMRHRTVRVRASVRGSLDCACFAAVAIALVLPSFLSDVSRNSRLPAPPDSLFSQPWLRSMPELLNERQRGLAVTLRRCPCCV